MENQGVFRKTTPYIENNRQIDKKNSIYLTF